MAFTFDLETTAITLPLDVVLKIIKAAQGKLDEETEGLLKIEVGHVLASMDRGEPEVIEGVMKDTFGSYP